ncbi:hypothetical protein INT43_000916 [Umbelopsis isabellina]|uniref:Copper acquisition factor BIM1-like domain-containing protein n=1 Tax=Mortierella isabellina TaxID=91625 RepID=A0A8H7UMA4_MORIS|nr:hypothetical protein INT43_000916 [Umbelopsis isabellina]
MVKFTFSIAAVLVAALSSAQAHYQLTYPVPRGPFSEDNEPIGPCATYNVSPNRTEFPLSKGFMEINSEHVQYTYSVHLVLNSNPSAADFTAQNSTVSNGTNSFPEQACLPVDLSKYSNIADGTNATLQIVYNAGDSILYECADVVLKSSPAGWNASACSNANGASPSGNGTSGGSTSSASALTASSALAAIGLVLAAASQF